MLKGIAASPGIEIGKVHVISHEQINIETRLIEKEEVQEEIKKLKAAIEISKSQLQEIKKQAEQKLGADKAEIFGAHLMVLEDPVLLEEIESKINNELITADNSVSQVVKNYV
ncbi:MAG TPA: phosphoenolpyruvate--protein phosphotransferase, partial [Thermoanaerobacterales bacterium]|nr:phosphoenolpyruvate--protein phosphotransferase [Thermoanaerobacterales bacterium]